MPGQRAEIYECHVKAVHEDDRVIDVVSRSGSEFQKVSYLLPWISANGSGLDLVPRQGDKCIVLAGPRPQMAESGRMVMCIGFKVPIGVGTPGLESGDRLQGLPQGSVALRAVAEDGNEALVLLTRGGTALISANDGCRTLYSPVDSSIVHVFNNWELNGPAGHVKWRREEGEEKATFEAQYRLGTDPASGRRMDVQIGLDDTLPFLVTVSEPGYPHPYLKIAVNADGEMIVEGEQINFRGRAGVSIDGGEVKIKGRQVLGQGDPI